MNDRWVVSGASPSAPIHFEAAVGRWIYPTTITCNGGAKLFNGEAPTYYWLHDRHAKDNYHDPAIELQKRGTQLVTLSTIDRKTAAMRGMGHFDILVEPSVVGGALMNGEARFYRGVYTDSGYSGLYCLQFAINNGAKKIAMVGLEGYRSNAETQVPDTFSEPELVGLRMGQMNTEQVIGPTMQDMVDQCQDIEFVFYGEPAYPLEGPNLEIVT